jgi:HlyD family secretion protein
MTTLPTPTPVHVTVHVHVPALTPTSVDGLAVVPTPDPTPVPILNAPPLTVEKAENAAMPSETKQNSVPQQSKVDSAVKPTQPSRWSVIKKWVWGAVIALIVGGVGWYVWHMLHPAGFGEGFISGNGRIEATEIGVATTLGGRVQDILVNEGDFVSAGQKLAHIRVQTLEAQLDEANARREEAVAGVASALAQVAMRTSDQRASQAVVAQRQSELDAALRRLTRSETLTREGAASEQELDDDRARVVGAKATVLTAEAQVAAARSAIGAAQTEVLGARSTVNANVAMVTRIKADIDDSTLTAPRAGRVQYRIAQPGEVVAPGGRVLNLLDVGDVYMTFFVPEAIAGQLALGTEVHLVLDAAPQYVIPSTISFVASTAQFTPKTVETASERQKLMFRVKAQIGRELLQKHRMQVKTGLPGVAWIKLDAKAAWPDKLALKVPD